MGDNQHDMRPVTHPDTLPNSAQSEKGVLWIQEDNVMVTTIVMISSPFKKTSSLPKILKQ